MIYTSSYIRNHRFRNEKYTSFFNRLAKMSVKDFKWGNPVCASSLVNLYFKHVKIFNREVTYRSDKGTNGDTHSETGGPVRLPAKVAGRWGRINWNSVRWGNKYFVLGSPEQPRQRNQPRKDPFPFICTLWVPIHLSFNGQQGPSLSGLSGYNAWLVF